MITDGQMWGRLSSGKAIPVVTSWASRIHRESSTLSDLYPFRDASNDRMFQLGNRNTRPDQISP